MTMYDAPSDRDYSEFLNSSEPELADEPTAQKIALYAEAGCTLDEMRAAVNWRARLQDERCPF